MKCRKEILDNISRFQLYQLRIGRYLLTIIDTKEKIEFKQYTPYCRDKPYL